MPTPKITAEGGVRIAVIVDGVEVSTHSQLHKAIERAVEEETVNPASEVRIEQVQQYRVELPEPDLAPDPEPEPDPEPDLEPDPVPAPDPEPTEFAVVSVEPTTDSGDFDVSLIVVGGVAGGGDPVTPPVSGIPAAPSSVVLTAGDGSASAVWVDNADDEIGFEIQYRIAGGAWIPDGTIGANSTSRFFGSLTNGQTIQMQIRATNANGSSAWVLSNIVTPQVAAPATNNLLTADTIAAINASIDADPTIWNFTLNSLERARTGAWPLVNAGGSWLGYVDAGALRICLQRPDDTNLAAFETWYRGWYVSETTTINCNPVTNQARDTGRSIMAKLADSFVWLDELGFWTSGERASLVARFGTWMDQWDAWLDTGIRGTFDHQDSDEIAHLAATMLQYTNILSGAQLTKAQGELDYYENNSGFTEWTDGDTGVYARGTWSEGNGYDDETPRLVARYENLTQLMGRGSVLDSTYFQDMAEWAFHTAGPKFDGRIWIHESQKGSSDYDYLEILGAIDYQPAAYHLSYVDTLFLNLTNDTPHFRGVAWLHDRYLAKDNLPNGHEGFSHPWIRIIKQRHQSDLAPENPYTLGLPLSKNYRAATMARSQAAIGGATFHFWKQKNWNVDHILWKSVGIELYFQNAAGVVTAVTRHPSDVNYVPNHAWNPCPSNIIYAENAYGGGTTVGCPGLGTGGGVGLYPSDGYHAVDGQYLWERVDAPAPHNVSTSSWERVCREPLWLPAKRIMLVFDRLKHNPNDVGGLSESAPYTRRAEMLWRNQQPFASNGSGFWKATHKSVDMIYGELTGNATLTAVNEATALKPYHDSIAPLGNAYWWPPAQVKYHMNATVQAADTEALHIIKYGDAGQVNPAQASVTVNSGDVYAHLIDGDTLVIFNRSAAPLTGTIEVTLPSSTAGINVYAMGLGLATQYAVSNPSGNVVRLTPGSGAMPQAENGTFGILVDTTSL